MRIAWAKLCAAASLAASAVLICGSLQAADETGVRYVAEELGSRTKTAQATTSESRAA